MSPMLSIQEFSFHEGVYSVKYPWVKTHRLFWPTACCLSCVTIVFRLTTDRNTRPLSENPITDSIPGKAGETLHIMATMQEHLLLVLGTCSRSSCNVFGLSWEMHSNSGTLLCVYFSLTQPHLQYCSFLWDPHPSHLYFSFEKVQYFACKLKINVKDWTSDYPTFCAKLKLPTLSSHCSVSKLTLLFIDKLLHSLIDLPAILPSSNLLHPTAFIPPHNLSCPVPQTETFHFPIFFLFNPLLEQSERQQTLEVTLF